MRTQWSNSSYTATLSTESSTRRPLGWIQPEQASHTNHFSATFIDRVPPIKEERGSTIRPKGRNQNLELPGLDLVL